MTAYDIIDAKKRGGTLSEEQIRFFVRGVADGSVSDAQIAAFCMAVLLRGMTDAECFVLTDAMTRSGEVAPRPNFTGICADKHSTGGVSDSTTLVLVPVLCALGVRCAKYSGRGLGHTGGTLDKLESFKGFNVNLTAEQFERQVEKIGGAVAGQTNSTVPADKRMYAVRDVTATVDSIPLIASSVMSKKLASFADVILLDVKYGDGAFMRAPADAEKLARLMVSIGRKAGRKMCAAVTCMDSPLGDSIGCNAEVREAVAVLKGKKNDLAKLSLFHCEKLASLALGISEAEARARAEESIASGAALKKTRRNRRSAGRRRARRVRRIAASARGALRGYPRTGQRSAENFRARAGQGVLRFGRRQAEGRGRNRPFGRHSLEAPRGRPRARGRGGRGSIL